MKVTIPIVRPSAVIFALAWILAASGVSLAFNESGRQPVFVAGAVLADSVAALAAPSPTPPGGELKKNGRPEKMSDATDRTSQDPVPNYFYEFSRPGFVVSHILIEHDSNGKGKISFQKKDLEETMVEFIQLSPATRSAIDDALARLDFLNSKEDYQYEKDRSNMGNIVFRYARDGRERAVKFNWTINKDAKVVMDEYRRIGNEAVWKFELAAARANQPLESPRLLEELDGYLKRDEISDPPHLIPLLETVIDDERLPLIARNHASRLILSIGKRPK